MTEQGVWSAFPFRRLVATQVAIVVLALAAGAFDGPQAARSAAAGAIICGAANVYAAWRVFAARRRTASQYGELANLYRAEFGKFVLIGAVSAALFAVSKVDILAFVGGCIAAILAGTVVAATFNPGVPGTHNTKLEDDDGE